MNKIHTSPGQAADYAFRLGVAACGLAGLAVVGFLYWQETLSLVFTGYVLLVLFPVYLVVVSVVLSVWLGFDKDITSLRPVYHEKESK